MRLGKAILRKKLVQGLAAFLLMLWACSSLKSSHPIVPIEEYERMIAGRLDADYVGTDRCLGACHTHDSYHRDIAASTMGAQMSPESGMPLVDCESCHGPGSLAIEGLTKEKVEAAAARGEKLACRHETLTEITKLPAGAKSLVCLKCHSQSSTFSLHEWHANVHPLADVSCSDCHRIHEGPDLIVRYRERSQLCFDCHPEAVARFSLPSRHPLNEHKVTCTDCHDPHGTAMDGLLKRHTIKETCTQCHGALRGPFAFEHADLGEDCMSCHNAHGSPNDNLLRSSEPFLCLQCHEGHWLRQPGGGIEEARGAFYTRCTDCHGAIHGSDVPSARGRGSLLR